MIIKVSTTLFSIQNYCFQFSLLGPPPVIKLVLMNVVFLLKSTSIFYRAYTKIIFTLSDHLKNNYNQYYQHIKAQN